MKTPEIELALFQSLHLKAELIVPNVYWGMLHYEADMVAMTKSGYATEYEIKVSRSDLLRDKKKGHNHDSNLFKYLYFVVPDELAEFALENIPDRAGLLSVCRSRYRDGYYEITRHRTAQTNKSAGKLSPEERYTLARLGSIRIQSLKKKIWKMKNPDAVWPVKKSRPGLSGMLADIKGE